MTLARHNTINLLIYILYMHRMIQVARQSWRKQLNRHLEECWHSSTSNIVTSHGHYHARDVLKIFFVAEPACPAVDFCCNARENAHRMESHRKWQHSNTGKIIHRKCKSKKHCLTVRPPNYHDQHIKVWQIFRYKFGSYSLETKILKAQSEPIQTKLLKLFRSSTSDSIVNTVYDNYR